MSNRNFGGLPGDPEVFRITQDGGAGSAVPMPARWIDAAEAGGPLRVVDRRVWVLLTAHSWPLGPLDAARNLPAKEVRDVVGLRGARNNRRLQEVAARLRALELVSEEGGPPIRVFDLIDLPAGSDTLTWRFASQAVIWASGSRSWMRVDMPVLHRISGHRAARLYMLIGLRERLRGRFWSVDAERLQRLIAPERSWRVWSDFEKAVLAPALERLEAATGWRIEVERTSCPRTRRMLRVRFTVKGAQTVRSGSSPNQSFS